MAVLPPELVEPPELVDPPLFVDPPPPPADPDPSPHAAEAAISAPSIAKEKSFMRRGFQTGGGASIYWNRLESIVTSKEPDTGPPAVVAA